MKIPRPRMAEWLILSALLLALIAVIAPQNLPVVAYKLALITIAAVAAYWLSRSLTPYARPDRFLDAHGLVLPGHEAAFAAALISRAVIVGAAMLAVSMGM